MISAKPSEMKVFSIVSHRHQAPACLIPIAKY